MKSRIIVVAVCAALVAVGVLAPALLNLLFDVVDMALGWMGGFLMVTLLSAGVGILFLLAFPHVSSQKGIKAVKDRIKYNLLGIRLFQDDLKTVLKSTGGTLGWNFAYLGLNVLPMIVLAAPFMVFWMQLNALYAFAPVEVGKPQQVIAELAPGTSPADVEVVLPEGVGLLSRFNLGDPAAPRLVLELDPQAPGDHEILLRAGGEEVSKTLAVAETDHRRLSRVRTKEPLTRFAAAEDPIVWFGETVLPASSFVTAVTVDYPPAPLGFMDGGEMAIMIWFVVVSLVVGFALKGAFGVEF